MSEHFVAARADLEWQVNDGQVRAQVDHVRRDFHAATGAMSDDALRLAVAQERLDKALLRHGVNSTQAKQAELAYRREIQHSTAAVGQHERAVERDHAAIGKAARGALAGSGAFRGFARSIAFASTAFLGGAGLTYAIRSSNTAFRESEVAIGRAENAVKNAGLQWSQYRTQIERVIQQQSFLSAFDDEELTETFARLVTRTKDVNEALRLNGLAADVARARNISLEAATQIVIKASLGQIGQLRRLGIELKAGATATEALAKLQQSYAGSAQRYAESNAGAQERLNVVIDNTQEIIGQGLAPAISELNNSAVAWLSNTENQARIQRDVNEVVTTGTAIVKGLADGLEKINTVVGPTIDLLGGFEKAAELAFGLLLLAKIRKIPAALGLIGPASTRAAATTVASMTAVNAATLAPIAGVGRLQAGLLGLRALGPIAIPIVIAVTYKEELEAGFDRLFGIDRSVPLGQSAEGIEQIPENLPDWARRGVEEQARKAGYIVRADGTIVRRGTRPDDRADRFTPTVQSPPSAPPAAPTVPLDRESRINLDIARAEAADDQQATLKALREKAAFDRKYIAIQEDLIRRGVGDRKQHARILERLYGDLQSAEGQIKGIEEGNRRDAKQAASDRKQRLKEEAAERQRLAAEAAAERREQAAEREQELRDLVDRARRTPSISDDRQRQRDLVAFLRRQAADARNTGKERRRYADEAKQAEREGLAAERELTEQRLLNNRARAELTETTLVDDRAALEKLRRFYAQLEHNKRLTLKERLDYESRRVAIDKELQGIKGEKSAGADGSQLRDSFLADVQRIVGAYAPNFFPVPAATGGKTDTHLYDLVHETRRTNAHLSTIVGRGQQPATQYATVSSAAAFA